MGEDPGRDTRRRLSVSEAAAALGVTVDAVRSCVKRGTIAHVRESGRVYVLLGADESRPGYGQGADQGTRESEDRTAELIATLREQLQAERQAHGEARRIIAGLVERIQQLEAAPEASEAAEAADEQQGRGQPHSDAPGAPEAVQRPWWRRVFGG